MRDIKSELRTKLVKGVITLTAVGTLVALPLSVKATERNYNTDMLTKIEALDNQKQSVKFETSDMFIKIEGLEKNKHVTNFETSDMFIKIEGLGN